jgi:hypothetical protein
MSYLIKIAGKRQTVESVEEAQAKWNAYRDASGKGCSKIGNGLIVLDTTGNFVAHISYNGRIWTEDPRTSRTSAAIPKV